MKETKRQRSAYEAPRLTVVCCRAEQGYAGSLLASFFGLGVWTDNGESAWI